MTARGARHRTSGHLFGGCYKAILADPEEPRYFATLLDYLHLNPVRAGLARPEGPGLLDYRWSSLRGYVVKRKRARWLTVKRGLAGRAGSRGYGDGSVVRRKVGTVSILKVAAPQCFEPAARAEWRRGFPCQWIRRRSWVQR